MPTKKQRRRRQKGLRHEWEEVYVDEEGRELDPDEARELGPSSPRKREDSGRQGRGRPPARKGVEPPSWRRVAKRSLFFAPVMFLVITFLESDTPILARVVYTLQLMLLFMPFSYLIDTFAYRMYRKRQAAAAGPPKA